MGNAFPVKGIVVAAGMSHDRLFLYIEHAASSSTISIRNCYPSSHCLLTRIAILVTSSSGRLKVILAW
jgi:hypothetical protein